jgi:putative sterol carrier protein
MATFHAEGKPNLTMLLADEKFVQVTKKCLCAMFGFLLGSIHVSKDAMYKDNNVVISSIYQVPSSGRQGLQWMVSNG